MLRRPTVAVWLALTACAGSPAPAAIPTTSTRSSRDELTARLCELLPARAHECVVSWPASVSPRRRPEVMTVSEAGRLSGADAPVRAYASCVDRGSEAAAVARVSVLLLAERPESREALEAALPISVRWEGEPCEADTCALPVARLEGDRLLLTRRPYDAPERAPDAAQLACAAVQAGAVEARAWVTSGGVAIRELHADEGGVEVSVRRRGHARTRRERFDWAELGLRLVDADISRQAALRDAEAGRVHGLSELDLTNESTVDLQIMVRERRLARDASEERLRDLAELLTRAYAAHPSRTELGVRAVERSIEAQALPAAHETLALLESLVEPSTPPLPRLRLALALTEGDGDATRAAIGEVAPDLSPSARASVALTLFDERGDDAIDQSASITLALAARGLLAIARRDDAALRPRAGRSSMTLRGVPAALAVLGGCAAPDAVVVCGGGVVDHAIRRVVTPTSGTLTLVGRAPCAAGVSEPASLTELSHVVTSLGGELEGEVDLYVACGEDIMGVGGVVSANQLTVTRLSRRLARTDVELTERWLAHPFASLDGRVFPAPTLTLAASESEAPIALAAARSVEGVRCVRTSTAIECTATEGSGGVRALADALTRLYASFAAD